MSRRAWNPKKNNRSDARLHAWAREEGFEIVEVAAYQPHYLTGRHKGFWSWTFEEAGRSLLEAGLIDAGELARLLEGMRLAEGEPGVLVAHARNRQLIARKPARM